MCLCDPQLPTPGSSRDSDSVIPFLCSLVGVATPSPTSIAGAADALPSLGFGPISFSSSSSYVLCHSVSVPSSVPLAFPSLSSSFPCTFPSYFPASVASAPVTWLSAESSSAPWLPSLCPAPAAGFPRSTPSLVVSSTASSSFMMSSILTSATSSCVIS